MRLQPFTMPPRSSSANALRCRITVRCAKPAPGDGPVQAFYEYYDEVSWPIFRGTLGAGAPEAPVPDAAGAGALAPDRGVNARDGQRAHAPTRRR
jgi:hypothetical protein